MSRVRRSRLISASLQLERSAESNRLRRVLILSASLRLCVNQFYGCLARRRPKIRRSTRRAVSRSHTVTANSASAIAPAA